MARAWNHDLGKSGCGACITLQSIAAAASTRIRRTTCLVPFLWQVVHLLVCGVGYVRPACQLLLLVDLDRLDAVSVLLVEGHRFR